MKPVSIWGKLKALYGAIPPMSCRRGCTDCCGIVPWNNLERSRLETLSRHNFRAGSSNEQDPLSCPYIEGGCCSVYEVRPFMCRLFGTTEALVCPHGYRPATPLSVEEGERLTKQYVDLDGKVTTDPRILDDMSR